MISQTVSHYRVVRRIGGGGMGVVYEAEDLNLGRRVALKFLPENLADDIAALERFQREARAASALNHPHICTIHDLGRHDGKPFLVMELLSGETLRTRLSARPIDIQSAIETGLQIADALAAAHAKGIVHRDIKPANLFITERGDVKILDFGLAKLREEPGLSDSALPTEQAQEPLTRTGSTVGTVAYMSPEQARGEELDARTDLFSLGVVLYEMATGRTPFAGNTSAVVYSEILGKEPTPPRQLNPDISPALETVCLRALEKDRALRYQNAVDLLADLKRLLRDSSSGSTAAMASPTTQRGETRRGLWVGVPVAATILAAAGLWHLRPLAPPTEAPTPEITAQPTIAVLPLQNLGADTSLDYLRLAVPDEITTTLSRVPSLAVRPFAAAAALGESVSDPASAGRELRAVNLVTGQYFTEGDRLQLTLEAINVEENRILWRQSLAVTSGDLLSLREQVASQVRDGLVPQLGLSAEPIQPGSRPRDASAYELYLRSLSMATDRHPNLSAIELLERVIARDPDYAPAWKELANRLYFEAHYGLDGREQTSQRAQAASERALALDPDLVGAASQLVVAQVERADLFGAFDTAAALVARRPDSAAAYFARSYVYRYAGLLDEAMADCERILDLDPLNPGYRSCGLSFAWTGRAERAKVFFQMDASSDWELDALGHLELAQGRFAEAADLWSRLPSHRHHSTEVKLLQAHLEGRTDLSALVQEIGARLEGEWDPEVFYSAAAVLAISGQRESALAILRRAIERNFCGFPAIDNDLSFAGLRDDHEFLAVRQQAIACRQRFLDYRDKQS